VGVGGCNTVEQDHARGTRRVKGRPKDRDHGGEQTIKSVSKQFGGWWGGGGGGGVFFVLGGFGGFQFVGTE